MKKNLTIAWVAVIVVAALLTVGCPKKDEGIDITDGTWGFFLETATGSTGVVYDFRGSKTSGSVYYSGQERGTFTVTGDNVRFSVDHFDPQGNQFHYEYVGLFVDYFNMSGTFTALNPDGSTTSGTFTATR